LLTKLVRWALSALGLGTMVLGLPDVPGQIAHWITILMPLVPYLDTAGFRASAIVVGIGIIVFGQFYDRHRALRVDDMIPVVAARPAGWALDGDRLLSPDMPIIEAYKYLTSRGYWANDGALWTDIRQAAVDGQIVIWGRRLPPPQNFNSARRPLEKIGAAYWNDFHFDLLVSQAHQDNGLAMTEADNIGEWGDGPNYHDLQFNRSQIVKWWRKHQRKAVT